MDDFAAYCYSLDEMAKILNISIPRLKHRIYTRTRVPPFQSPGRGVYWFPKESFIEWAKSLPVEQERSLRRSEASA